MDGNEALATGEWESAAAAFRADLEAGEGPEALEGLAQAAWWLDDGDLVLDCRERAYRAHRERGDAAGAARAAIALASDAVNFGAGQAVSSGWLERARTLLATEPTGTEHGWLAIREAEFALHDHDPEAAVTAARRAVEIGSRLGDSELVTVGTALDGLTDVAAGRIGDGMRKLDNAVAAATGGDVRDLMWLGKVCCFLISACDDARDVERAAEWCGRVEALCQRLNLAPLFLVCRTQYAAVLVARGEWMQAERELRDVLGRLRGSKRASVGDALSRLGELRRRQGRLDEAERLFRQSEFQQLSIVGRAAIALDRGHADEAAASLRRFLAGVPESGRLSRVLALELLVRASLAGDDHDAAAAAAGELRASADAVGTAPLRAAAALADGLLAGTEGGPLLEQAVRLFEDSGLRYDEARARLELGRAELAARPQQGRQQLERAGAIFRELEAAADLARVQAILDPDADASPLTARETEVLRLVAAGRTNREIAEQLVISEHTVHRHVANIRRKLGQASRAAAAAYAVQHSLI